MTKKPESLIPKYTTLSSLLDGGPQAVNLAIAGSGHNAIDIREDTFDVQEKKEQKIKELFCRGTLVRHKKRGTKVTIIKPLAKEGKHLVIESKTGKEFYAKHENLEKL